MSRRQSRSHLRGFTLIELMVALTIVGIALGVGVPAFNGYIANQRAKAAGQDLVMVINYARSEALKRNGEMFLRARDANDWAQGWIVTPNAARTWGQCNVANPPQDCLRIHPAIPGIVIEEAAAQSEVRFNRAGRAVGTAMFIACDEAAAATERRIEVTAAGRPNLQFGGACG
jgi:type IV fimbrial biogenesis protein FimT